MQGGADETERLPEAGVAPPSKALVRMAGKSSAVGGNMVGAFAIQPLD